MPPLAAPGTKCGHWVGLRYLEVAAEATHPLEEALLLGRRVGLRYLEESTGQALRPRGPS